MPSRFHLSMIGRSAGNHLTSSSSSTESHLISSCSISLIESGSITPQSQICSFTDLSSYSWLICSTMDFGCVETPISSMSSLIRAVFGSSPASIFPPGNSHQPAHASPCDLLQASILSLASNSRPPRPRKLACIRGKSQSS